MGQAGRTVAAVAALVLTAGSVNAYLSGATEMLRELAAGSRGPARRTTRPAVFLGFIAVTGLAVIGLSATGLADIAVLVSVPTTMFVCVYLSCTAAAVRLLGGRARLGAMVAVMAVVAILAFCGWGLAAAAVIAAIAMVTIGVPARRAAASGAGRGPGGRGTRRDCPSPAPRTGTAPLRPCRGALLAARALRPATPARPVASR
jgi:amino acid efflux transporter